MVKQPLTDDPQESSTGSSDGFARGIAATDERFSPTPGVGYMGVGVGAAYTSTMPASTEFARASSPL